MADDEKLLELVRKIKESRRTAAADAHFELLDRSLRPLAQRFFTKKGFSPAEVEELTQEALIRVFQGIETFRGDSSFLGWFFEILSNVFRNELRRRHSIKREGQNVSIDEMTKAEADDPKRSLREIESGEPDALQQILTLESQARFQDVVEDLPPQMRRVCKLRFVQQRKYREIAELMGISIETVKAHLHQAKKRLERDLGPADR